LTSKETLKPKCNKLKKRKELYFKICQDNQSLKHVTINLSLLTIAKLQITNYKNIILEFSFLLTKVYMQVNLTAKKHTNLINSLKVFLHIYKTKLEIEIYSKEGFGNA
jgi:hypothetical protein